ncbi:TRAP transporter small permease subunit [Vibrio zhugei]|uniref:TRAP transporter small permease protein n=1 Tax=Vibrio zhugei TaxID=2479546 RepID=A0ABV7CBL7_9VIBR|nr:TRAP transporter small permease [Vibrio zhugei]
MECILRTYCRCVRYVVGLVGRSVAYLLPLLAAIVAYGVFARYILNQPTIWGYDTSLFLFGYIGALGGANAQRLGGHINVDIVYGKLSRRGRHVFDLVNVILAMGFLWIMMSTCLDKFIEAVNLNYRTQSEWAPPMHHFWLMVTVSAGLFLAQYSTELIGHLYALVCGKELLATSWDDERPEQIAVESAVMQPLKDKESAHGH